MPWNKPPLFLSRGEYFNLRRYGLTFLLPEKLSFRAQGLVGGRRPGSLGGPSCFH
jgi:hypothetical protein